MRSGRLLATPPCAAAPCTANGEQRCTPASRAASPYLDLDGKHGEWPSAALCGHLDAGGHHLRGAGADTWVDECGWWCRCLGALVLVMPCMVRASAAGSAGGGTRWRPVDLCMHPTSPTGCFCRNRSPPLTHPPTNHTRKFTCCPATHLSPPPSNEPPPHPRPPNLHAHHRHRPQQQPRTVVCRDW